MKFAKTGNQKSFTSMEPENVIRLSIWMTQIATEKINDIKNNPIRLTKESLW